MKKTLIILIIFLVLLFGASIWFYFFYFRGISPAILKSPQNIADLLSNQNNTSTPDQNTTDMPLQLPQGFSISIFAKDLPNARVMAFDESENLWVSQPNQNTVSYLEIKDGNVIKQTTPLENLNKPHGLAVSYCTTMCIEQIPGENEGGCHDTCELYVAQENEVTRFLYNPSDLNETINATRKKIVELPAGGRHATRTLLHKSDSTLLVSIGSSCDVCYEEDNRRASIIAVDTTEGKFGEWQSYAVGLRNSVFMTRNPKTNEVWATEMGRDFLGDNLPPDEINIIKDRQLDSNDLPGDYGWPICYGKNIHDAQFDKNQYIQDPCASRQPSHIDLQAHSAPLGLAFIPDTWPEDMRGDLLVAYHGSWNRSTATGYKVVRIKLDEQGNYEGTEDFITGWLTSDNRALGRPVDLVFDDTGDLYISDDKAGVIYKVVYSK
ncbi:MAG: PQQ-dependent sugar dehydrogenase [Candidatus Magasanikbacteria bacterium]